MKGVGSRVEGVGCKARHVLPDAGEPGPLLPAVFLSGFRVQGSGFRVQGSGFRVQGSGFRVQGSGSRVQGSGSTPPPRRLPVRVQG